MPDSITFAGVTDPAGSTDSAKAELVRAAVFGWGHRALAERWGSREGVKAPNMTDLGLRSPG